MSTPGTAAIWWRVSTDDQKEISPETQIIEARALAIEGGFATPEKYVIGTDWHSLSVWDSPAMLQLRSLITQGAISAVVMYDADRGPSKPAHRLMMRALCEESGVRILCRYGQVPDGEMGEVMEFLSAWSKEKQVHRAQQGAKDGLRDRALVRGLPVTGASPYGYQFRYELQGTKPSPVALEIDPQTHIVAQRIWALALSGTPLRGIARELTEDGIPTARNAPNWTHTTIGQILKNPIYAGRYYALRHEAVEPQQRRRGYGKSSRKLRAEPHYLEGFPISSPVVSWDEFEHVQAQLTRNKLDSRRNAKRTYILAGILFCEEHGRRMAGHSYHQGKYYRYECTKKGPSGDVQCPTLSGPAVDQAVWNNVVSFLSDPRTVMGEMERRRAAEDTGAFDIEEQIANTERGLRKVNESETELVMRKLDDQISEDAFASAGALLKARRSYLTDEMERLKATHAGLVESHNALEQLERATAQITGKLVSAELEDRRWVLQALATRISHTPGGLNISIGVPAEMADFTSGDCGHQTSVLISRTKLATAGRWAWAGPWNRASQRR